MTAPRRYALLDCEDDPAWPGYQSLWVPPLERPGEAWEVLRPWAGELPSRADELRGVVISGSHHSVNDPAQRGWLEPLLAWVRDAFGAPRGPQIVGGCFGLQVLARSLGGEVTANPKSGYAFGTEQIELEPSWRDAWFAAEEPPVLTLLESHSEQAIRLPPGAVRLARSTRTDNEIFAIGSRALGLQGHPEFTRDVLVDRILPGARADGRLDAAGERAALASLEQPVDSGVVIAAIRRFLDGPGS